MSRRERPWKKLRVIVEVSVPPTCRAGEKDLIYAVEENLPKLVYLPRPIHANAFEAHTRVKGFTRFWPWFLRSRK